MQGSWFFAVYGWCERQRWLALGLVVLLTGCAVASLWMVSFDTRLELMLPEGSEAQRMMACLRDARFSDKVVISLEQKTAVANKQELMAAVDRLAASLQSPLVTRVLADFSGADLLEEFLFFFRQAPQILNADDLAAVAVRLTPEGVDASLRRDYLQLLKPEGAFLAGAVRADPLGMNSVIADKLRRVAASAGYNVALENGHMLSADGRHALLIVETTAPLTDSGRSRELIAFLQAKCRALPASISADLICGHLHTLSNEKTIKRDIALTNSIAAVIFILAFLWCFRDLKIMGMIFFIPVAAALIAIPLSALIVGKLSYLVIGLGSVIAGVAVDYGIHIYVAVRHDPDKARAARRIAAPVAIGATTSMSMFAAFLFSSIRGYHQLAWFSMISIALALACGVFLLPQFVRSQPAAPAVPPQPKHDPEPRCWNRYVALAWAFTMLIGVPASFLVPFDGRMTQLDGTEKSILQTEARFRQAWGGGENGRGLLVLAGPHLEDVLRDNDIVYAETNRRLGKEALTSLAAVWPARQTREENAARWVSFWQNGREAKLRQFLAEQGGKYSFSRQAFAPFFERLYQGTDAAVSADTNLLYMRLREQFIQKQNDGYRVFSFFPDSQEMAAALSSLAAKHPNALVVSPRTLAHELSVSYSREILKVSGVAVFLIVLVAFLLLRDVRLTLISLVPALTAVVWLLAVMAMLGYALNIANLIAGVVVFGLSLDYGFIMMHRYPQRLDPATRTSVHMSAITTIIGTAALLFALHPALFSIGFTLTVGVLSGYVAAMFVVPALYHLWFPGEKIPIAS